MCPRPPPRAGSGARRARLGGGQQPDTRQREGGQLVKSLLKTHPIKGTSHRMIENIKPDLLVSLRSTNHYIQIATCDSVTQFVFIMADRKCVRVRVHRYVCQCVTLTFLSTIFTTHYKLSYSLSLLNYRIDYVFISSFSSSLPRNLTYPWHSAGDLRAFRIELQARSRHFRPHRGLCR